MFLFSLTIFCNGVVTLYIIQWFQFVMEVFVNNLAALILEDLKIFVKGFLRTLNCRGAQIWLLVYQSQQLHYVLHIYFHLYSQGVVLGLIFTFFKSLDNKLITAILWSFCLNGSCGISLSNLLFVLVSSRLLLLVNHFNNQ